MYQLTPLALLSVTAYNYYPSAALFILDNLKTFQGLLTKKFHGGWSREGPELFGILFSTSLCNVGYIYTP